MAVAYNNTPGKIAYHFASDPVLLKRKFGPYGEPSSYFVLNSSGQGQIATITIESCCVSKQVTRDITGVGANPALLNISDGATFDFGVIAANSSVEHTFTVDNVGGTPSTSMSGLGLAAPFSFKDGSYPGTGGSCGASLNNGAQCTIVVTYAPTASARNDHGKTLYDFDMI